MPTSPKVTDADRSQAEACVSVVQDCENPVELMIEFLRRARSEGAAAEREASQVIAGDAAHMYGDSEMWVRACVFIETKIAARARKDADHADAE